MTNTIQSIIVNYAGNVVALFDNARSIPVCIEQGWFVRNDVTNSNFILSGFIFLL